MPVIIGADPIPIPADNEAGGVNITSTKGYIHLITPSGAVITIAADGSISIDGADSTAFGGGINLAAGDASAGEGGGFSLFCGDGTTVAGGLQFRSGKVVGDSSLAANVLISPNGADSEFIAASSATLPGSNLELGGGSGTVGGDVLLTVGSGTNPHTDNGKLKLSAAADILSDANNGQAVTFGLLTGPGSAAVSIKRWIPITVDGQAGWIPHFGV